MSRGWAPTGPAEPISIHGAGGSASSEKGARHWGQGGGAGGDAVRQAASLGHGAGWPQSLFSNRGENSPREEPPAGGSTRLGEKRETRGELGEVLASLVAAHAPTASPRLRRRRRPPRGPAPEVRLRQFRCSG